MTTSPTWTTADRIAFWVRWTRSPGKRFEMADKPQRGQR